MSSLQLHDSKMEGQTSGGKRERNQNIQVYVRVRPMSPSSNQPKVIDTPGFREVVVRERTVANVTKTFTFDKVFNSESTQLDVYRTVVAPLLKEVLLGYNCTVFAYGQTGTGKTYTMEGELTTTNTMLYLGVEGKDAGILPRALSELFDEVRAMSCDFQVRASYLELYNEELFDLLAATDPSPNPAKKTLRIYEDANRKGSVVIQGLEEVIVQNKQEVYEVLRRGSQHRTTASTVLNHSSSRSHSVFTITVHMKESNVDGEEMVKVGKLHLVDLAGSENIGKSGAVDKRAREAGSINQSLLTLGRVITALVERTPHVPYRESKLTRLLQDSLGGKTKTSIIATISPAQCNIEETLSTLDYAHRAKNIMNKPEVNQRLTKREALSIYTEEIERLRRDLNAARNGAGFFIDQTNYNLLQTQIASMNLELIEKNNNILSLKDMIEKQEEELIEETAKTMELEEDNCEKMMLLEKAKHDIQRYQDRLVESLQRADELEHVLRAQSKTEKKLSSEADCLLHTANETVATIESLYKRLDRKNKVEDANLKHTRRFRKDLDNLLNNVVTTLHQVKEKNVLHVLDIMGQLDERKTSQMKKADHCGLIVSAMFSDFHKLSETLSNKIEQMKKQVTQGLAQANLHFMDDSDTSLKKMSEVKDSLSEMLQSMKTHFGTMKTEITKMKTVMTNEFDALETQVKIALVHDMEEFSRLETVLTNVKSDIKTLADEFEANNRCFELRQDKYKERYQQKIALIQKTLDELKLDTDEYVDGSATDHKNLMGKFNVSKVDWATMLSDEIKTLRASRAVPEKVSNNFAQYREKNVSAHQKQLTNLYDKVDDRIQASRQIEKKVNAVVTTHTEMVNEHLNYMSVHNEKIDLDIKTASDAMKAVNDNLKEGIVISKGSVLRLVDGVFTKEMEFMEKLKTMSNTEVEQMSTDMELATSEVKKISGFQNEFWDVNYLHDTPTGMTPMKREYQYPTTLSATSPHERVIKRYRMVSKRIQETLVECESADSTESTVCASESGDESNMSEEERLRKESEAKVLEIEAKEQDEQRKAWEDQDIKRRIMHRRAQMELEKGTPLKDLVQELGRAKGKRESKTEDDPDALKGKAEAEKDVITNPKAPKSNVSPIPEEKENAMPNPEPASSNNKKRRNSGGKKKKGRN